MSPPSKTWTSALRPRLRSTARCTFECFSRFHPFNLSGSPFPGDRHTTAIDGPNAMPHDAMGLNSVRGRDMALLLKRGDSLTQTIHGVFPEGGLGGLAKFAIDSAGRAVGASALSQVRDASMDHARSSLGGLPFPGYVEVYSDRYVFTPTFAQVLPIYSGVAKISIPIREITGVNTAEPTVLMVVRRKAVDVTFSGGRFRLLCDFDRDAILSALRTARSGARW